MDVMLEEMHQTIHKTAELFTSEELKYCYDYLRW